MEADFNAYLFLWVCFHIAFDFYKFFFFLPAHQYIEKSILANVFLLFLVGELIRAVIPLYC